MDDEKIKMFKIKVELSGAILVTKTPTEEDWLFTEAEVGDKLFIECVEMTPEEIAALPEFTGF